MKRWLLQALAAILVIAPLSGCITQYTDGLGEYWAPPPTDEGSTFDPKTRQYAAPQAKFEVTMPGVPVRDRHYQIRTTNAKQRVKYETPTASYVVATAEIPTAEAWQPEMIKRIRDSEIMLIKSDVQALTENVNYPVTSDDGKFIGRHVEGRTRDGKFYRARNYLDQQARRVYRLVVVGTKEGVESPETNEFFNTFRVTQ